MLFIRHIVHIRAVLGVLWFLDTPNVSYHFYFVGLSRSCYDHLHTIFLVDNLGELGFRAREIPCTMLCYDYGGTIDTIHA